MERRNVSTWLDECWCSSGTDAALASVISAILVIVGKQSIGAGIAVAVPIAAADKY